MDISHEVLKLSDSMECIRKTLKCALCNKLPVETRTAKCGHLFCKICVLEVLHTRRAVCSTCKTVITRSAVRPVENIDKIIKDFYSLCEAIEKDAETTILSDRPPELRQHRVKRGNLTLPGPSGSVDKSEGSSRSDLSKENTVKQNIGRRPRAKTLLARKSIDSEETIRVRNKRPTKKSVKPSVAAPSTSRATNNVSGPVFTTDDLSDEIKSIGCKEKVEDWLNSEEFEDEVQEKEEVPEIAELQNSNPTPVPENSESFSQALPNSSESAKSGRNSRVSETSRKSGTRGSVSTAENGPKFKSFTFEATNNKKKKSIPKVVSSAEKMFDELCKKTVDEQIKSSWTELARFKKETKPKVRKRKKLNVSVARPGSSKCTVESLEQEDSEKKKEVENIHNIGNENPELNEGTNAVAESPAKRKKPNLVSYKTLDKTEMIDINKLNRQQLGAIIGVPGFHEDLNASKTSTNSPDKSSVELSKNKLSLKRSHEHSRDNSHEEEATLHIEESSRPQSKQSIHPNDSRPGSRLSNNSTDKPASEKFRLSIKRRSATPNAGPSEISVHPDHPTRSLEEEQQEKIRLGSDSPIRICNDSMRNKLSLKTLSSGSSKMTDCKSRNSTNVRIKKMGKLYRPRNRIKFVLLGSTRTEGEKRELQIKLCDAQTQTSLPLVNIDRTLNDACGKHLSSESMARTVIPETRTASAASSSLRQIEVARIAAASSTSKTVSLQESPEKNDAVIEVSLISPEEDSQLKYLATKSPLAPRISRTNSENSAKRKDKFHLLMRAISSSTVTPEFEKFSRAVKIYAERLVATDSEDQDSPNEGFSKAKHRKNGSPKKTISGMTVSSVSKTTSSLSDMRMGDEIETAASSDVTNIDKSPPVQSVQNSSEGKLSYASPKRNKYSKESFGSQSKRRSAKKLKSVTEINGSYHETSSPSDAETVLLKRTKNEDAARHVEDSDTSITTGRHKVVRKLMYSQESGSNHNTGSAKSGSSELETLCDKEKKSHRIPEKKLFRRIRQIASSDSENESLEISLPTKPSSSNSETIARPQPTQDSNESPILSEDMTIIFSSNNKETQESKRKRSPSPNPLNNTELQAIVSQWCAELDAPSEEVVLDNNRLLANVRSSSAERALQKKPRVEAQGSPASTDSDNFPALSATAIYGKGRKPNDVVKTTTIEIDNPSLNDEESILTENLEEIAKQFDSIDGKIEAARNEESSRGTQSSSRNNTIGVNLAENTERSIKRGNTFNGIVTTRKNPIPIKAKSIENIDLSPIHRQSQNSDKENERKNEGEKKREENKGVLANTEQKMGSNGDLNKSKITKTHNMELLESSFDEDCLNITQEQIWLQEIEDNLLGRNSKNTMKKSSQELRQEKTIEKTPNKSTKKTLKKTANNDINQKVKGYQIAQIDDNDSEAMDEDIIESTPERDLQSRKDLHSNAGDSQSSSTSLKSFMSVNVTPIPKTNDKYLQITSDASTLLESNSTLTSNNRNMFKNLNAGPPSHSTPKAATTFIQKRNSLQKSSCVETIENKKQKLCFVCSNLKPPQVQGVIAFARKHNVEYTTSYKPEVTHVIIETNEKDSAGRTLKYLLGVAHKKWVVSYRWVIDSWNHNKILEEEDYEVVDHDTGAPGPRQSRLSKKGLFDQFSFTCVEPFTDITIEQLEDLLSSTGGMVVQSLEDLATVTDRYRVIVYDCEIHEEDLLDHWSKKGRGLPLQMEWILACISQYKLISSKYFLHKWDPDLISRSGFPPELLAKTDEEEESSPMDA